MVEARLRLANRAWEVTGFDLPSGLLPADPLDFDAYFIGGSPASVNDDLPWISDLLKFIRSLDALRIPVIGLCFGHQAIATALGGRVGRSPSGWQLGVVETLIYAPAGWMVPPRGSVNLYASHNEQITALPHRARVVGSSDGCEFAAISVAENMLSTQYHPEFSQQYMRAVLSSLAPTLPKMQIQQALQSLSIETDSDLCFTWLASFIEEAWARSERPDVDVAKTCK